MRNDQGRGGRRPQPPVPAWTGERGGRVARHAAPFAHLTDAELLAASLAGRCATGRPWHREPRRLVKRRVRRWGVVGFALLALLDLFVAAQLWDAVPARLSSLADESVHEEGASPDWPVATGSEVAPRIDSVEATHTGATEARLVWHVVDDGVLVTNRLSCRQAESSNWFAASVLGIGTVSWTLAGLAPAAAYECHVFAMDGDGRVSTVRRVQFETRFDSV